MHRVSQLQKISLLRNNLWNKLLQDTLSWQSKSIDLEPIFGEAETLEVDQDRILGQVKRKTNNTQPFESTGGARTYL